MTLGSLCISVFPSEQRDPIIHPDQEQKPSSASPCSVCEQTLLPMVAKPKPLQGEGSPTGRIWGRSVGLSQSLGLTRALGLTRLEQEEQEEQCLTGPDTLIV